MDSSEPQPQNLIGKLAARQDKRATPLVDIQHLQAEADKGTATSAGEYRSRISVGSKDNQGEIFVNSARFFPTNREGKPTASPEQVQQLVQAAVTTLQHRPLFSDELSLHPPYTDATAGLTDNLDDNGRVVAAMFEAIRDSNHPKKRTIETPQKIGVLAGYTSTDGRVLYAERETETGSQLSERYRYTIDWIRPETVQQFDTAAKKQGYQGLLKDQRAKVDREGIGLVPFAQERTARAGATRDLKDIVNRILADRTKQLMAQDKKLSKDEAKKIAEAEQAAEWGPATFQVETRAPRPQGGKEPTPVTLAKEKRFAHTVTTPKTAPSPA